MARPKAPFHVIRTTKDGHVWICEVLDPEQHEADLAKFSAFHGGDVQETRIDAKDIPDKSERYRAAWTFDHGTKTFGHDMAKARAAHVDAIRAARPAQMVSLDAAFNKALEAGGDTKAIASERQRLRDAPTDPRIAAAKTIDDLKAAWPL